MRCARPAYAHLERTIQTLSSYRLLVGAIKWAFPAYDYGWLVDEIETNLPRELDFVAEADNADRCRSNFSSKSSRFGKYVHIPGIHKEVSSPRVLTMEFVDGASVRDTEAIRNLGFSPRQVAWLVASVFNEMIFHFGDVHCDPHAANMMLRKSPSGRMELVLLDHGLYR
jgi:aarF domain-containing kinase